MVIVFHFEIAISSKIASGVSPLKIITVVKVFCPVRDAFSKYQVASEI